MKARRRGGCPSLMKMGTAPKSYSAGPIMEGSKSIRPSMVRRSRVDEDVLQHELGVQEHHGRCGEVGQRGSDITGNLRQQVLADATAALMLDTAFRLPGDEVAPRDGGAGGGDREAVEGGEGGAEVFADGDLFRGGEVAPDRAELRAADAGHDEVGPRFQSAGGL